MRNPIQSTSALSLLALLLAPALLGETTPSPLLSHFDFEEDASDRLGNSPPMRLINASIENGVLLLPENPPSDFFIAEASIPALSYNSFAIAFDFLSELSSFPHNTILSAGSAYRWLGFEYDTGTGRLALTLNNSGIRHLFDLSPALNQWHHLVCSVDLEAQRIVTFLDSVQLPDIHLQNFRFNVVGTDAEENDKAVSFWNSGNASRLSGRADNLRIYNRALTPGEITNEVLPVLSVRRVESTLLVHWPSEFTGYHLESTETLFTSWQLEPRPPITLGNQFLVLDFFERPQKYFRLRRQP